MTAVAQGMKFRGAWSSSTSYQKQDVVEVGSVTYVAAAANRNSSPPNANWVVLASTSGGAQGAQGSQGAQGVQGGQGSQGVQGVAGTTASQGAQGSQGSAGTQGPQGFQGLLGASGSDGAPGPPSSAILARRTFAAFSATTDSWSAPDANALDITGTIDLRALIQPVAWNPGTAMDVITKWTTSGNQRSYMLSVTATGAIKFSYSPDGAAVLTIQSTVFLGAVMPTLGPAWIRVVANPNVAGSASADFSYSLNGVDWTALGGTVTNATPGPWFSSTATLHIGGTALTYNGRLYIAEVWNTGTSTRVARFNATNLLSSAAFTDADSRTWTPGGTSAIGSDVNTTDIDFADSTLRPAAIEAVNVSTGKVIIASAGKATWGSPPGSNTGLVNVNDYGANNYGTVPGRSFDSSAAVAAAIAAIQAKGDDRGGLLFFPDDTYRLDSGMSSNLNGLVVRGLGGHGGWPKVGGAGPTVILVGAGAVGFDYNLGAASSLFGPARIEGMTFMPLYAKTSGVLGPLTNGQNIAINTTLTDITGFPSAAGSSVWIQDSGNLAHITYASRTSSQLTNITIVSESYPGATYANNSVITVAAQGGIRMTGAADIVYSDVNCSMFNHQNIAAFGIYHDGVTKICQYGRTSRVWVNGCANGVIETRCSTDWVGLNIDANLNGDPPAKGTVGYQALNPRNGARLSKPNIHGTDTCIWIDGQSTTANHNMVIDEPRLEAWYTQGIYLTTLKYCRIRGGSYVNFQAANALGLTNLGNSVTVGANVQHVYWDKPGPISNCSEPVVNAASNLTVEREGLGSPEGAVAGSPGSTYRRNDGSVSTSFYVKQTTPDLKTGWVPIA